MGIEQTAFFTSDKQNSGTAVGMFSPKPKIRIPPRNQNRTRRPINPGNQSSKGEKNPDEPEPSNPLTFGLLDY